jgi:hypothetical protein
MGFELARDDSRCELVRAGFATATAERVMAGRKAMEVATLRITPAGRRALAS